MVSSQFNTHNSQSNRWERIYQQTCQISSLLTNVTQWCINSSDGNIAYLVIEIHVSTCYPRVCYHPCLDGAGRTIFVGLVFDLFASEMAITDAHFQTLRLLRISSSKFQTTNRPWVVVALVPELGRLDYMHLGLVIGNLQVNYRICTAGDLVIGS